MRAIVPQLKSQPFAVDLGADIPGRRYLRTFVPDRGIQQAPGSVYVVAVDGDAGDPAFVDRITVRETRTQGHVDQFVAQFAPGS